MARLSVLIAPGGVPPEGATPSLPRPADLAIEARLGEAPDPVGAAAALARLRRWWVLPIGDADPRVEARRLLAEGVEQVWLRPSIAAPFAPPPTEADEAPLASHRDPAPIGVDATWAHRQRGGRGDGVQVVDVEQAWDLSLGPVPRIEAPLVLGASCGKAGSHGAQSLATLGAPADTDEPGLAPEAALFRVSPLPGDCPSSERLGGCCGDQLETHLAALAAGLDGLVLRAGDVVLLEVEYLYPTIWYFKTKRSAPGVDRAWHGPVEGVPPVRDAIRLLAALGVLVVEPTGNALELDLDTASGSPGPGLPEVLLTPTDPAEHSGALVVGGSYPPLRSAPHKVRQPHPQSGFGARVDSFAWAQSVRTGIAPGYGGTSAAGAVIAGTAASLQGMARATLGRPLTGMQLRALLRDRQLNTPALDDDGGPLRDRIGVMPDLRRLAGALTRQPVLDPGEDGLAGSEGLFVTRPGSSAPTDPWADGALPDARTAPTGTHRVYVRARNAGKGGADVRATVWTAPPATLVPMDAWELRGTTGSRRLGRGATQVLPPLTWAAPGRVHHSLLALLAAEADPLPPPSDFPDLRTLSRFLAGPRALWRSLDAVAPGPDGAWDLTTWVSGPLAAGESTWVLVEASPGLAITLEVPRPMREDALPAPGEGLAVVGVVDLSALPRGALVPLGVHARLGPDAPATGHRVLVRQFVPQGEVGRRSWHPMPGV